MCRVCVYIPWACLPAALRETWGAAAGQSCALWFDNYYKPRYVSNPAIGYATLNCSALAILRVAAPLPVCRGLPAGRVPGCTLGSDCWVLLLVCLRFASWGLFWGPC